MWSARLSLLRENAGLRPDQTTFFLNTLLVGQVDGRYSLKYEIYNFPAEFIGRMTS